MSAHEHRGQHRGQEVVGMPEMEAEHELLIAILHEIKEALAEGRRDAIPAQLARFEDAAAAHFMEEQSLMRLHTYPGYAAHEQEHDDLIAELRDLSGRISDGQLSDLAQAAEKLETWLMSHMKTTDEALEEFLREAGIRPGSSH